MSVLTLVCTCGMRLKAPGAVPGRVGKCPRCGSMLKVPDEAARPEPPEPITPATERPTFIGQRSAKRKQKGRLRSSDGLVTPPKIAETSWRESLTYPLWNDAGLAILAFMPVGLWFTTVPLFAIVPMIRSGSAVTLIGLIVGSPVFLMLLYILGLTLRFLGQVLVTSALGEVEQPRSTHGSLHELGQEFVRWSWALIIGGMVGGLPAVFYWINCGQVDWLDRIVLVDLIIPGLGYAQMALLAALIFESPLASNPVTVFRAIYRAGWAYVEPCVVTGSIILVLIGLLVVVLRINHPLGQSVAYWAFWFVAIYASMVVMRRLGLFCYRQAVVLEWSPDRTRPAR